MGNKYAIVTGGIARTGTAWLTHTLVMNAAVDARITRRYADRNSDEFVAQWRNGAREFYLDVGSDFRSVLPVFHEFSPKVVLLVRNPYHHLRSIISYQIFNEGVKEQPKGARSVVIKRLLSQIYGSVELGAQLLDSLELEWKPFGIRQFVNEDGVKTLADFIELPVKTPIELAEDMYRNVPKGYIDLDDWYSKTCMTMMEFDKLYPAAVEIFERTGELARGDPQA